MACNKRIGRVVWSVGAVVCGAAFVAMFGATIWALWDDSPHTPGRMSIQGKVLLTGALAVVAGFIIGTVGVLIKSES